VADTIAVCRPEIICTISTRPPQCTRLSRHLVNSFLQLFRPVCAFRLCFHLSRAFIAALISLFSLSLIASIYATKALHTHIQRRIHDFIKESQSISLLFLPLHPSPIFIPFHSFQPLLFLRSLSFLLSPPRSEVYIILLRNILEIQHAIRCNLVQFGDKYLPPPPVFTFVNMSMITCANA